MPKIDMHEKQKKLKAGLEYIGVDRIDGPLVYVKKTHPVGYRELVEVVDPEGKTRLGLVLDTSEDVVCVQIFEGTSGLTMPDTHVRFMGEPLKLGVSEKMLGRVFNGLGQPIDNGPAPVSEADLDINGMAINPVAREYPRDFIQTGISVIDGMNTLSEDRNSRSFQETVFLIMSLRLRLQDRQKSREVSQTLL